jgi:hypothetical protein
MPEEPTAAAEEDPLTEDPGDEGDDQQANVLPDDEPSPEPAEDDGS